MAKRYTEKEILAEFNKIFGNKYDYSMLEFKNMSTKVTIICSVHGEFRISPSDHKKGVGCRKCYIDSQKITKQEFIQRSKKHFGDRYDYSLFTNHYLDNKKVKIRCCIHNTIFLQEPRNHMRGHTGCPMCRSNILSGNRANIGKIRSQEELNNEFKSKAIKIHGDKYIYDKFNYINSSTKGEIICKEHGSFYQTPGNHLKGTNCPECAKENKKKRTFKFECKEKGIDYHRALKRRQAGLSDQKIFQKGYIRNERVTNEIEVYGIKYPNLSEAIRTLKPASNATTISRWIREGMSTEEAFERIPNPGYSQGIIYLITNQKNNKKYIGLTIQSLERRWKYHIEQANAGQIKSRESLHADIRKYGKDAFSIEEIERGITKKDLEAKERKWIRTFNTLIPNGYNISRGGVSGGSNKKPTNVDGVQFESVKEAIKYLAETRSISKAAAKRRLLKGRIDVKTRSKPGESLIKTKTYKAWSRIIHGALNPKSKQYIAGLSIYENWRDFNQFYNDVGEPSDPDMCFARINKCEGFFPENCTWMTKSQASKINYKHMEDLKLLKFSNSHKKKEK